ncbi:MAG: hypothetical protein AB1779_11290 [Candidatus Thermoplasmatota archaeon]
MGVKVMPVKCPKCNSVIQSKKRDMVFYCSCGTIHTRNGGQKILAYEIADFMKQAQGDKIYVPFWRLYANVNITAEKISGGFISQLANLLSAKGGNIFIFVPGVDWSPDVYKYWAQTLTLNPPRYYVSPSFNVNVERIPCEISDFDAAKYADFLVLTFEAEKPGVLQYIDYSMKVMETKLIYLPFYRAGGSIYIGI